MTERPCVKTAFPDFAIKEDDMPGKTRMMGLTPILSSTGAALLLQLDASKAAKWG